MAENNPLASIRETYYENKRRLANYLATKPMTPPAMPPSPSQPSASSAAQHPMFGPIPPHLLCKYASPNLSYSLPPPDRSLPPPLSYDTHICAPSSQQLSKPVSPPTLQSSSPLTLTHVEIIEIEDDDNDSFEPPLQNHNVTHNNHPRDVIIIKDDDDDDEDDFYEMIAKHKDFIEQVISNNKYPRSLGSGTVGSMSEVKGKKISDDSVTTKRKIDDIHPRSDKCGDCSGTKRCF